MSNGIVVVDISHYQPTPNWSQLIDGGVVGVILKCTEGESYVDDTFRARYDAALAAGLSVATYHFLRPGDLERQMNWYLANLQPRQGERLCLDHEDDRVSLAYLEECVEYLKTDTRDLQITIYSGHVIKDQLVGTRSDVLADNTSLWLAQYASSPTWPSATWPTWTLWQFTDKGTVAGISGNVDGNRFNGPVENCIAWLGPATAIPEPAPEPEPIENTMLINVITNADVTVELTVNGVVLTTVKVGATPRL